MHFFGVILLIQVFCVVHVIKSGRNNAWIMAIMFFPLVGCIAYFIVEILPDMQGNRHVRRVRNKAVNVLDPEKEIRHAREHLEITDSIANQVSLADALMALGQFQEALSYYQKIVMKSAHADDNIRSKYAHALFECGQAQEAVDIFVAMKPANITSEQDKRRLLHARALEHLGRNSDAEYIFEEIAFRMAGEEARCRYAALLLKQGKSTKAQMVLEDVEKSLKELRRNQLIADSSMYDWAVRELKTLRQK